MPKKKPGPKKIAKSRLRKKLNCTVDQRVLKAFHRAVKFGDFKNPSRAVDIALGEFVEARA